MSRVMAPQDELGELLERLTNGELTAEGASRLSELLGDDALARKRYLQRMAVETELHMRYGTRVMASEGVSASGGSADGARAAVVSDAEKWIKAADQTAPAQAAPAQAAPAQAAPAQAIPARAVASRSLLGSRVPRGVGWAAIAGSLAVFAAGIAFVGGDRGPSNGRLPGDQAASSSGIASGRVASGHFEAGRDAVASDRQPEPEVVAKITATRNCRWVAPEAGVGYGATVVAGQRIELAAGVAEITFDGGAKVVLEGPATLEVSGGGQATLLSGQLAASIPRQTPGFWLGTKRIGVGERFAVAQDAEFGLLAYGQGGGEVHVFDGRVHAHLFDDAGERLRTVELASREAARVTPASTTVAKFHADRDRFVRSLFSGAGPHDGLYAYEGFEYPAGPLSWQNGGFGWAGPWADIEATGVGESATNEVAESSLPAEGLLTLGGAAMQSGQRNRVRRALSTSLGGVFDSAGLVENRDGHRLIGRDGQTLYFSFLQRVSQADDVFYGFELHRGDGNHNRTLCIGNGADGAGYGVTSNYNAYGVRNYPSLGEESTEANFLVVRIDFGSDDRDRVMVYRNPESMLDEKACTVDARLRGNFAFDRISLGNFDGVKVHEIDEIRIGTAFRAVTGQRNADPDPLTRRVAGRLERRGLPGFEHRGGRRGSLLGT